MDALPGLLEKLQKDSSAQPKLEICLDELIALVDERNKDDEIDVQKAIVESPAFQVVMPFLSAADDHPDLTTKVAKLIAELAKIEEVRVPLVNLGVVPPLLKLIQSPCSSPVATQVCRALGNICFDNDEGRKAVDDGDGIPTCLQLIQTYTLKTEDGAARTRVLACGFILNLTNECDWLQDKAVDHGALVVLDSLLKEHAANEDLYNMAVAAFLRIADCDSAKSEQWLKSVISTLTWVVSREKTGAPLIPILEELIVIAEDDKLKQPMADSSLPSHLLRIIRYNTEHNAELPSNAEECVRLAADLLLSLLVGDGSMEALYGGGEGEVYKQCVQWLNGDRDNLKVLGSLAIGNFGRSDAHCRQLVDSGMVEILLSALKSTNVGEEEANINLQHAVLSSLRNLAIPACNKGRLLGLGVMTAVLELKHTEMMVVTFKLLGVLRMLIDGQEEAAKTLGQDREFINCLVDWCAVEEHAGVKGEATRLMAWMIKNSRSAPVMRILVRAEGLPHLVTMATSEHAVMQNEALVALNLIASSVLGDAAVSFKESGISAAVQEILKNKETAPELMCNTLALVRTLGATESLREDLINSGLPDVMRQLSSDHQHQGVKNAVSAALVVLEEETSR